jgi:hypothetical protein
MKLCKTCGETKPESAFSKNASKKDGLHTRCKPCDSARNKKWYAENRERDLAKWREWYAKNRDRDLATGRAWYAKNKEKRAVTQKAWNLANKEKFAGYVQRYRERHPDRIAKATEAYKPKRAIVHREWYARNLETKRAKNRMWSKKNPARHNMLCAKRRHDEVRATPAWANLDAMEKVYAKARAMTKKTGVKHDVDHIIPLRGKLVCGLHVESNLQILSASLNRSKGAKHVEHSLTL